MRPERDPEMRAAVVSHPEENPDGIRAFFIFPHILEVKGLAGFGNLTAALVRESNKHLPLLGVGERFKKGDDLLQFWWVCVHALRVFAEVTLPCFCSGSTILFSEYEDYHRSSAEKKRRLVAQND